MTREVNANDLLAFFVEVAAVVLIGMGAWRLPASGVLVRGLTVVVLVGMVITLWALFAAPKATIDEPALAVAVRVLVMAASAVAAYGVLSTPLASAWTVVAAVNTLLVYVGPFARP